MVLIVPFSHKTCVEVSYPLVASVLLANLPLMFPLPFTPEGCLPLYASLGPGTHPGKQASSADQKPETQTRGRMGHQLTMAKQKFSSGFPIPFPLHNCLFSLNHRPRQTQKNTLLSTVAQVWGPSNERHKNIALQLPWVMLLVSELE